MVQLLLGLMGTIIVTAAAIVAFYAFSYAVLYVVGRALPLAGRRKRR